MTPSLAISACSYHLSSEEHERLVNFPTTSITSLSSRMPLPRYSHSMVYGRCFSTCRSVIAPFFILCLVSMIIMLGFYRPSDLVLGPNSPILLQPSPFFVQYIKVKSLGSKPRVLLYGTHESPLLDVVITWTENHNVSIQSKSHKEWEYYLNIGSELSISYRLSSESSTILLLVAECVLSTRDFNGYEGLSQWLENPTYPDTTLSWNLIHGTGIIRRGIFMPSSYYVALGNLNEKVEVELNLRVKASLCNTTSAYYKCALTSGACSLSTSFHDGNTAVLASPGSQENSSGDVWHVELSYGPRWVTYIFSMGGMPLLMFLAIHIFNKLHHVQEDSAGVRHGETAPQRAPLLSQKDDDCSSRGSSYDSMTHDEEDLDFVTEGSIDGKPLGDGETSDNTWHLCAICFDAPRDCFFLPCGHCVACFACGTRIAEETGTCPVCRRKMKKVRKIFTI